MSKARNLEGVVINTHKSFDEFTKSMEEIIPGLKNFSSAIQSRGSKTVFDDLKSLTINMLRFFENTATQGKPSLTTEGEKEELTNFATKVRKMSKIASNIEQASEEYIPKIWNILSQGIKGLLAPLAGIISPIVDLLKNLGNSFIEGIQSIFSKPLEGQLQACLNVTKNVGKVLDQIGDSNQVRDNNAATVNTTRAPNSNPAAFVENMRNRTPSGSSGNNITPPPPTPSHKQGPSSSIQR